MVTTYYSIIWCLRWHPVNYNSLEGTPGLEFQDDAR